MGPLLIASRISISTVIAMNQNRYDQAHPANPAVRPADIPACPACGGTWLYNVQQVEEERRYRVLGRGSQVTYEPASINWTVYLHNHLECADCEWTCPMDSAEAERLLDE